jgi:hypothetical protein
VSPDDQPLRRDFEHLSQTVEKLTRTLEGLQVMMAATYVRQDVYAAHQKLHDKTHDELAGDIVTLGDGLTDGIKGLKESVDGLKANNQWWWKALVNAVLPIVVNAIVLAIVLSAAGGKG